MSSASTSALIHLRHDQILCACYEWVAKRGLKPRGVNSMNISRGADLVFPETGQRRRRYKLVFECEDVQGRTYFDEHDRMYVFTDETDAPWPI